MVATLQFAAGQRRVEYQCALTLASYPQLNTTIAHLRDVLGDKIYESLARRGEIMTGAAMASYAYDQID